jgi:uncharacterized protein (DUF1499 family)
MGGVRNFLVGAAVVLAVLLPIYFLVAAFGTKFRLLDWRIGFGLMTFQWGVLVIMGAAGLSVLALLSTLLAKPRFKGALAALAALAVPAAGLGYGAYVKSQTQDIPPIHDVTTNMDDPPAFSAALVAQRAKTACVNTLNFADKRVGAANGPGCRGREGGPLARDLHAKAYGDLAPVRLNQAPSDAFEIARDAAEAQGWTIVTEEPQAGVIEATATSFWYGFKDDVAIRLRPTADGMGATLDVRSVSRVGVNDIGANAKRVRAYLAAVESVQASAATGG